MSVHSSTDFGRHFERSFSDEKTSSSHTGRSYERVDARQKPPEHLTIRTYNIAKQLVDGKHGAKVLSREDWKFFTKLKQDPSKIRVILEKPEGMSADSYSKKISFIINNLSKMVLVPPPVKVASAPKPAPVSLPSRITAPKVEIHTAPKASMPSSAPTSSVPLVHISLEEAFDTSALSHPSDSSSSAQVPLPSKGVVPGAEARSAHTAPSPLSTDSAPIRQVSLEEAFDAKDRGSPPDSPISSVSISPQPRVESFPSKTPLEGTPIFSSLLDKLSRTGALYEPNPRQMQPAPDTTLKTRSQAPITPEITSKPAEAMQAPVKPNQGQANRPSSNTSPKITTHPPENQSQDAQAIPQPISQEAERLSRKAISSFLSDSEPLSQPSSLHSQAPLQQPSRREPQQTQVSPKIKTLAATPEFHSSSEPSLQRAAQPGQDTPRQRTPQKEVLVETPSFSPAPQMQIVTPDSPLPSSPSSHEPDSFNKQTGSSSSITSRSSADLPAFDNPSGSISRREPRSTHGSPAQHSTHPSFAEGSMPAPVPTLSEPFKSSGGIAVMDLPAETCEFAKRLASDEADDAKLSRFQAAQAVAKFDEMYGNQDDYDNMLSVLSDVWLPSITQTGVDIGSGPAHRSLAYLKLFSSSNPETAKELLQKLKASDPSDEMFWYCFQFSLLKSVYEFAKEKLESNPKLDALVTALQAPPFNISENSYKLPDVFRIGHSEDRSTLQSTTLAKTAIFDQLKSRVEGLDLTSILDDPSTFRSLWAKNNQQIFRSS